MSDEFSPEERAALEDWTVREPPADFVERVLAREQVASVARRRRSLIAGVAIAASIAAVVAMTIGGRAPINGTHSASARTTLTLGDRATIVSEPGTDVSWSIGADGGAEIVQKSGNIFYRVERGGPFVVHTPQGDVHVLGTCFRVEVNQMRATSSGLIGAGVGAALATTVMVTVYEGKVSTASPHGQVAIEAGESAKLEADQSPQKLAQVKRVAMPAEPANDRELEQRTAALADLPANATPAQVLEAHRALKKEADKMRAELDAMKGEIAEARAVKQSKKTYDLDQATLNRMAEKCELAWDMQPLGNKPMTSNPKDLETLKIAESEREVIDRVYEEDHRRVLKELAAIYTEVTGDTSTGSLAPGSMFEEIIDKAPKGEIQRVFHKLSHERAGLLPPSADSNAGPWERVFRLMTGAGDGLEAALAKELGPDTAKALRDLHNGWGSRSRSSSGCPEGQ